jgi:hypothetical protein
MINLSIENEVVSVSVLGEFTLADYREFEQAALYGVRFQGRVNVLFDLRDMLSFTLDVAWEELKFSREHRTDFGRIAILTDDQWVQWSTWISRLFVDADIRLFDDYELARAWVRGEAEA